MTSSGRKSNNGSQFCSSNFGKYDRGVFFLVVLLNVNIFCYNGSQAAAPGPLWLGHSQKITGSVMMDGARLIFLKEHKKDDVQIQQQQQRAIVIRPMRFKVQRRHAVCTSARQHRRNVAVCRLAATPPPPPQTPQPVPPPPPSGQRDGRTVATFRMSSRCLAQCQRQPAGRRLAALIFFSSLNGEFIRLIPHERSGRGQTEGKDSGPHPRDLAERKIHYGLGSPFYTFFFKQRRSLHFLSYGQLMNNISKKKRSAEEK